MSHKSENTVVAGEVLCQQIKPSSSDIPLPLSSWNIPRCFQTKCDIQYNSPTSCMCLEDLRWMVSRRCHKLPQMLSVDEERAWASCQCSQHLFLPASTQIWGQKTDLHCSLVNQDLLQQSTLTAAAALVHTSIFCQPHSPTRSRDS